MADLSKYFDTIPHAKLLAVVSNLYLHLLDRIWERHDLAKQLMDPYAVARIAGIETY